MVLSIIANTLLCFNIIVVLSCNFFETTRRGFLVTHWSFINWLYAVKWDVFCSTPTTSGFDVLYPLATILIAIDHVATVPTPSEKLCSVSRWLFTFLLLTLDSLCLLMLIEFRYEMLLMMLLLVTFTGCLLIGTCRNTKYTLHQMYEYSTDSLFSETNKPFSCFGHFGWLLYGSVFFRLLREAVPTLHSHALFSYVLYVCLCLGTFDFLATPAIFGGLLNSFKVIGNAISNYGQPSFSTHKQVQLNIQ